MNIETEESTMSADYTDWTQWLGDAAEDMTDGQRERFEAAADEAMERIGDDPDDQGERDAALTAICQYVLGETTLDAAGERRTRTMRAEREASIAAQALAVLAVGAGMAEAEAARRARLDRMTVRKALGKS